MTIEVDLPENVRPALMSVFVTPKRTNKFYILVYFAGLLYVFVSKFTTLNLVQMSTTAI